MSAEGQPFTLSYYTADDTNVENPPFKYRTFYLEDALAEAWRIQSSGGRFRSISYQDRELIDSEEFLNVYVRISELVNSSPLTRSKRRRWRSSESATTCRPWSEATPARALSRRRGR